MRRFFLSFTLLLFFIGCSESTDTTNKTIYDTPKATKAHVNIIADKKILTIGIDDESELSFTCDTSVSNYKWYVNDTLFSEDAYASFETPSEEETYTITLTVEDDEGSLLKASTQIVVRASDIPTPSYDVSFSTIRNLIANNSGVTYICYGDSTRSNSQYNNHYVFENIKDSLSAYGVSSINKSVTGIRASDAANSSSPYTNWSDLLYIIDGSGENTILDISLGINDFDEIPDEQIKNHLKKIVTSIRASKPYTHFILTVPSRTLYDAEGMSNRLITIYRSLSTELQIPYINVPAEAMPLSQLSSDWYIQGDYTHLTQNIQRNISNLILSKIRP